MKFASKLGTAAGAALLALTAASAAFGHDFWVQPTRYWIAPNSTAAVSLQVGHGKDRVRWDSDLRRVTTFRTVGPGGVKDQRSALRIGAVEQDHPVAFGASGTYLLYLTTDFAESELPGLRFTDYAKAEGLTAALAERDRTKMTDRPGREMYTRRAKAIVQVGPVSASGDAVVMKPLGLSLEIVPEANPYAVDAGDSLPVRVIYEGKPLAGATVKLNNLDFDFRPIEVLKTDAAGRAVFRMPRAGSWQLNVIWSKPIKSRRADFETTFSSLTFGFPPGVRPAAAKN